MKIVISLGGSVVVPEKIDKEYVSSFAGFIKELSEKHSLALVVGGGRTAREYIEVARGFGSSETFCDMIGINVSRINAMLLISGIGGGVNLLPFGDLVSARKAFEDGRIVVMGGAHPGQSTDAVAALLAEFIGADLFINASDVDGVYDRDPQKYGDARRYDRISTGDLLDILKSKSLRAGKYELIDTLAVKVIRRSRIKTIFLCGRDLKNMGAAIDGRKFVGTAIRD